MGFCALALLTALFFTFAITRAEHLSNEAYVYEGVCRELMNNTTEGRQALVGSAWWPPLVFLVRLPIATILRFEEFPVASLLVSAFFGAAVFVLMDNIMRIWRLGWIRIPMLAGIALNPWFLRECLNGSSATMVLFLCLLVAYGFVDWLAGRSARHAIYMALAASLLVIASAEMIPWVALVLLIVVLDLLAARMPFSQKGAVLLLVLLPVVYTVGLWILMNWLVLGDGLYFIRSVAASAGFRARFTGEYIDLIDTDYMAMGIAGVVFLLALLLKNRGGVWLAVVAVGPVVVAMGMREEGFLWSPVPVLFCLMPLAVLTLAYLVRVVGPSALGIRPLAGMIPLSAVIFTCPIWENKPLDYAPSFEKESAVVMQNRWLPKIEGEVLARSKYARVFVAGYESFILLGSEHSDVFQPVLDFNFNKAKDDYRGQNLFLLVCRPVGRGAVDSIHWKYPNLFFRGTRSTLYDSDWGRWRLFEIIQAPR